MQGSGGDAELADAPDGFQKLQFLLPPGLSHVYHHAACQAGP